MKIFTGKANPEFAQKVASHLDIPLGHCEVSRFADGEVQVSIKENVRGSDIFIIQSTSSPVNENYMELFILMDAVKRASAREITLVMPYYGYARQDRKAEPRAPISARCIADLCQVSGAKRLLVVDLHAPQIQGFFNGPVDNLFAFPVMAQAWLEKKKDIQNIVCVSPDTGAVERTRAFAKRIKSPMAIIDKRRDRPNEAKAFHVIGDIKGKTALIVDDMIDTAGTLCVAVDHLIKKGAREVYAIVTHAVFSGSAVERIKNSRLKEVWVTDTIALKQNSEKIHCVSVAPLVAEAMKRIYSKGSVSALFD
ncbi:MAG: ribose-phosphate pyrophosphokinase [Oligoflexia bacterium]|nr:ribose-phosphate pyrophosphokinase [Oligoflexia bacterium]